MAQRKNRWLTSKSLLRALTLLALLGTSACATGDANDPGANDPLESANRTMHGVNQAIDTLAIRPLGIMYRDLLPPIVQTGINNALRNLNSPRILANDLLQGELDRAGTTFTRFLVNTTVGVAGLGDPATDMGYAYHDEDFGQTLAVWGVGEGPYLVLPVLGPSNPRDAAGIVVDHFLDPVNWWATATDHENLTYARSVLALASTRAEFDNTLEDLQRTSLDYYAALRSLYRQRRADQIRNGAPALGGFDLNSPAPGDPQN
ncbi:MAG: MlaA family lipoprotein [Magnetospiraceae bacterium]